MSQEASANRDAQQLPRLKWCGERVDIFGGSIEKVAKLIPSFERRPFVAVPTNEPQLTFSNPRDFPANKRHDLIVRTPLGEEKSVVPVGIVSKTYGLVQHKELFDASVGALEKANIDLAQVNVELMMSEYRGRMGLHFTLPPEYEFDPGDGNPIALRLVCFNSVDASSRLWAVLGWLRMVCENGLILGRARLQVRFIHNSTISVSALTESLQRSLTRIPIEKRTVTWWLRRRIEPDRLAEFVDGPLKDKWGVHAAARVFLICQSGFDGTPIPRFERLKPTLFPLKQGAQIPGASAPAENAFAISQALSWVAKAPAELKTQLDRSQDIPALMQRLLANRN